MGVFKSSLLHDRLRGMLPLYQEIALSIAEQFQGLMGKRDRPMFTQLLRQFGKHESVRNPLCITGVIPQCVFNVGLIPKVNHCVPAQFRQFVLVRSRAILALQPESGAETPIRRKIGGKSGG